MYSVKEGFRCDRKSKEEFIESTNAYWHSTAPEWTLKWYGSDKDGHPVELSQESDVSHLDLFLEASKGSSSITYAIELKERWDPYVSTYYGEEGSEGWVYNYEKDGWLHKAADEGYVPIYANVYPDGVCRVWNISNLSKEDFGEVEKPIKRQNVVDGSPRVMQKRRTLMNKSGKTYRRLWKD